MANKFFAGIGRFVARLRPTRRGLATAVVRLYTTAVLCVVLWSGYLAVTYLFRAVFKPLPVPQRFLDWQGHLDAASLREDNVPGITGPAARAPLGHYHRVDRWFQPDAHNSCTTSGCHLPLPHGIPHASVAATQPGINRVAAFANLHATFMDCQVCHESGNKPVAAQWVDLKTGQPREVPAMLQLASYLSAGTESLKKDASAAHAKIIALLRSCLQASSDDPILDDLLVQIDTSAPGGQVWLMAVEQLVEELPRHMRGEYGAKLAREKEAITPDDVNKLSGQYLKAAGDERVKLHREIHNALTARPNACLACHGEPGMVDFERLGYPAKRAKELRELPLAKKMQEIREGGEFELPRVPGRGGER